MSSYDDLDKRIYELEQKIEKLQYIEKRLPHICLKCKHIYWSFEDPSTCPTINCEGKTTEE